MEIIVLQSPFGVVGDLYIQYNSLKGWLQVFFINQFYDIYLEKIGHTISFIMTNNPYIGILSDTTFEGRMEPSFERYRFTILSSY